MRNLVKMLAPGPVEPLKGCLRGSIACWNIFDTAALWLLSRKPVARFEEQYSANRANFLSTQNDLNAYNKRTQCWLEGLDLSSIAAYAGRLLRRTCLMRHRNCSYWSRGDGLPSLPRSVPQSALSGAHQNKRELLLSTQLPGNRRWATDSHGTPRAGTG